MSKVTPDPEYVQVEENIYLVRNFLTKQECLDFIENSEQEGYEGALINTGDGHMRDEDVRNNDRVIIDDFELSHVLWQRINEYIDPKFRSRFAIGVNERLRYYRYDAGQLFDWHHDGYFQRDNGERSQFTFMIYLNDEFEGGETKFYIKDEFAIKPEAGMALLFAHSTFHTGAEVTKGRKYVLRSDIMYSQL